MVMVVLLLVLMIHRVVESKCEPSVEVGFSRKVIVHLGPGVKKIGVLQSIAGRSVDR